MSSPPSSPTSRIPVRTDSVAPAGDKKNIDTVDKRIEITRKRIIPQISSLHETMSPGKKPKLNIINNSENHVNIPSPLSPIKQKENILDISNNNSSPTQFTLIEENPNNYYRPGLNMGIKEWKETRPHPIEPYLETTLFDGKLILLKPFEERQEVVSYEWEKKKKMHFDWVENAIAHSKNLFNVVVDDNEINESNGLDALVLHNSNSDSKKTVKVKDKYYVLTHGQMGELLPLAMLNKAFVKRDDALKSKLHKKQKFMYHPDTLPENKLTSIEYKNNGCEQYPNHVLSVDAWLKNTEAGESAYDYLCERRASGMGVLKPITDKERDEERIEFVMGIVEDVFEVYLTKNNSKQFVKEFKKIVKEQSPPSNLWIYAVPKEIIKEIGYLSRPFGVFVKKWNTDKGIQILERMQEGELKGNYVGPGATCICGMDDDSDSDGEDIGHTHSYQMRLFTHELNDPRVKSFHVPEMSQEDYKKLKESIKTFANKFFDHYNSLQGLAQ